MFRLLSLKKEVASPITNHVTSNQPISSSDYLPTLPTRPVRPIRWTYSSISLGKSKLITWRTLGISRPRAATAVATRIGYSPVRKANKASSRSRWVRSPWILVDLYLREYKNSSKASAPFLVSVKIRVRDVDSKEKWSKNCLKISL